MPKQGIVAFEDAYITITDYPRADEAIVHYNDGTVETIVSGYSAEAMNYEIYNMVEAIKVHNPIAPYFSRQKSLIFWTRCKIMAELKRTSAFAEVLFILLWINTV